MLTPPKVFTKINRFILFFVFVTQRLHTVFVSGVNTNMKWCYFYRPRSPEAVIKEHISSVLISPLWAPPNRHFFIYSSQDFGFLMRSLQISTHTVLPPPSPPKKTKHIFL